MTSKDYDKQEDIEYKFCPSDQKPKSYDITKRIENGFSRIIHEENPTSWRSGIRVKVIDEVIGTN